MFEDIKNDILGKKYSLSIAFIPPRKSRELNHKYRGKDKPTNVLSFALSKNEGELLLCREVIRKETKMFGRSYKKLLGFLVIHGMLHLKGMRHGAIMERLEEKYDQKYFYRNKRRIDDHKSGSSRTRKGKVGRRKNSKNSGRRRSRN